VSYFGIAWEWYLDNATTIPWTALVAPGVARTKSQPSGDQPRPSLLGRDEAALNSSALRLPQNAGLGLFVVGRLLAGSPTQPSNTTAGS
jgi:hypothetical protein